MPAPDSITLALETSNPSAAAGGGGGSPPPGPSVALRTPRARFLEPLQRDSNASRFGGHDDDLMPAIDRLFSRAELSPRDLSGGAIVVSIGPGGYTGLRVACAVAKMIAESTGAQCIAVPTPLALIRRVDPSHFSQGRVAVSLAGKGDSSYLQLFDSPPTPHSAWEQGRLITAADIPQLAALNLRTLITDRFLPDPIRAAAQHHHITLIDPTYDALAVLEAAEALPTIDPADLVPLYPREPDAVTLWRAKKQS